MRRPALRSDTDVLLLTFIIIIIIIIAVCEYTHRFVLSFLYVHMQAGIDMCTFGCRTLTSVVSVVDSDSQVS